MNIMKNESCRRVSEVYHIQSNTAVLWCNSKTLKVVIRIRLCYTPPTGTAFFLQDQNSSKSKALWTGKNH